MYTSGYTRLNDGNTTQRRLLLHNLHWPGLRMRPSAFAFIDSGGCKPYIAQGTKSKRRQEVQNGKPGAIIKRTPLGLACSHALGVSV